MYSVHPAAAMGEAVYSAKHRFAPLNADTDTNRIGWTSLAMAVMLEMQAGDCSYNTGMSYIHVGQSNFLQHVPWDEHWPSKRSYC